jgi:sodium--glutamate symport carrier gltS
MKKIEFIDKINPKMRSILFIIFLILIGLIIGQIIGTLSSSYLIEQIEEGRPHFPPDASILSEEQKNQIQRGVNIISTILSINIILLIGLIYLFISSYIKIRSRYLIGFVIFVGVFLIKSLSNLIALTPLLSEPIKAAPLAISPLLRGNFGPFGSYFMIFEIIAICILIYLSRE